MIVLVGVPISQAYSSVYSSNRRISGGNIYCNPNKDAGSNDAEVIAHELGHCLGLGHSDDPNNHEESSVSTSLMRMNNFNGTAVPQAHDNSDLKRFYGFTY